MYSKFPMGDALVLFADCCRHQRNNFSDLFVFVTDKCVGPDSVKE